MDFYLRFSLSKHVIDLILKDKNIDYRVSLITIKPSFLCSLIRKSDTYNPVPHEYFDTIYKTILVSPFSFQSPDYASVYEEYNRHSGFPYHLSILVR